MMGQSKGIVIKPDGFVDNNLENFKVFIREKCPTAKEHENK